MLAPPSGNILRVYLQTERNRRRQIRRRAIKEIERVVQQAKPLEAEISEGASADWYLVTTFPGEDTRAMRWLARRRFGAFRPMQQRRTPHREGQAIGVLEPVFPGYLFVYVWEIGKMRSRLLACPGVAGLLCTADGKPMPVNQPDEDGQFFIDKLRALAWVYSDQIGRTTQEADRQQRPPKLGRRERRRSTGSRGR